MQSSQWLPRGDQQARPIKFLRSRATGKVLLVSFFNWKGIVHREFLRGQTVKARNFIQILHRMRLAIARKCPRILNSFYLHMDNAPTHRAHLTKLFDRMKIKIMPHPPYSPDIAPSDFWFFPVLKKPRRGHRHASLDELEEAVDCQIGLIPSSKFANCILNSWPERWLKCYERDGEYFEGLH